jgi:hypothetical protein
MKKMKAEWANIELTLKPFKETGTVFEGSSSVFSSDSMGGISTKVSSVVSHLSLRILGNGKRYNFLRGGAGGSFGLRSPLH